MSLINKMLQDLETRQDSAPSAAKPAYQGLSAVPPAPRFAIGRVIVLLGIALILGVGFLFGGEKLMDWRDAQSRVATVTPSDSAVSATAGSSVPAPVSTPAPSAVVAAAPAVPAIESKPLEPLVPPAVTSVAPAAKTPAVEPKPQPVAAKARAENSRAQPALGIVKQGESPAIAAPSSGRTIADNNKASKTKIETALVRDASSATMDKKIRPLSAEDSAEAEYRQALRLFEQGRSEEALRRLRQMLTAQPTHIKARELAAGIELQTGHWREAQRLLEDGLRQASNHYLFARMLARVYIDHGSEAKALTVMESASPQGSQDAEFSALLGLLYQRAGRHADAIKGYERALALRPDDARTWLGFAISLEGTEQWGAAKSAYRRARDGDLTLPLATYAEQRLAALQDR